MSETTHANGTASGAVRHSRKSKTRAAKTPAVRAGARASEGVLAALQARLAALRAGAGDVAGTLQESLSTAATGLRAVNLQAVEYAHGDADRLFKAAKAVLKAKSLREALEIQGDFVRTQVQTQFKQARQLGTLSVEQAREAIAPIQSGLTKRLRAKPARKAA